MITALSVLLDMLISEAFYGLGSSLVMAWSEMLHILYWYEVENRPLCPREVEVIAAFRAAIQQQSKARIVSERIYPDDSV